MRRRVGSAVLGSLLVGAAVLVAVGPASPAAADGGSIVYGWGSNDDGAVGIGTAGEPQVRPMPVVGQAPDVVQVTGGYQYSVALHADGTVWTWGDNEFGTLGDGSTAPFRTTPGRVPGLPPIAQVDAGVISVLAVGVDGSVWAWGDNRFGQLGDGTQVDRSRPVQVPISRVTQVAAGGFSFSMARRSDGTVWTWGRNDLGELGDGTNTNRLTPVRALTPYGIAQVAAGGGHALALRFDGSVWAWGDNEAGQLGDGTIWAWGYNAQGQLGDGSTTTPSHPVHLTQPTGVARIDAGQWSSLAVLADGTLWAWGSNTDGEAGNGHVGGHVLVPTQVPGLTGVVQVSAGFTTVLALAPPPPFSVVPDLTDDTSAEAAGELGAVGLVPGLTTTVPDIPTCFRLNRVVQQSEAPGTVLPRGAAVSFVIAVLPPDGCRRA